MSLEIEQPWPMIPGFVRLIRLKYHSNFCSSWLELFKLFRFTLVLSWKWGRKTKRQKAVSKKIFSSFFAFFFFYCEQCILCIILWTSVKCIKICQTSAGGWRGDRGWSERENECYMKRDFYRKMWQRFAKQDFKLEKKKRLPMKEKSTVIFLGGNSQRYFCTHFSCFCWK